MSRVELLRIISGFWAWVPCPSLNSIELIFDFRLNHYFKNTELSGLQFINLLSVPTHLSRAYTSQEQGWAWWKIIRETSNKGRSASNIDKSFVYVNLDVGFQGSFVLQVPGLWQLCSRTEASMWLLLSDPGTVLPAGTGRTALRSRSFLLWSRDVLDVRGMESYKGSNRRGLARRHHLGLG